MVDGLRLLIEIGCATALEIFRMALYWLTYKRNRRLAGVAIVSASSLLAARARAAVDGIGKSAMYTRRNLHSHVGY